MGRRSDRRPALRIRAGAEPLREVVTLAGEEPLEVRLGGEPYVVTMRTPGDDMDLVAGYLVAEGVVWRREHLVDMRYCRHLSGADEQDYNTVSVGLSPDIPAPAAHRSATMTSACGVCGVDSIADVDRATHFPQPLPVPTGVLDAEVLLGLPDALRERQKLFGSTGGVHAAALADFAGGIRCVREDVGRHNAVDKVVGWALREGRLPLADTVLQVSGRASFELVQKAAMAGIPVLAAVSAPSSLAAALAEDAGVTLAGFSRGDRVTVYTHPERIAGLA